MWIAISIVILAFIVGCVTVVIDELLEERPARSEHGKLRKKTPLPERSIGLCMLLSVITFGIYGIYWMYLLVKNTHYIQKNTNKCMGEILCLIFAPFYNVYWWYTTGKKVRQRFVEHNYNATGNEILYLIFAIIGLDIVSMAIMQSDFNSLKSETCSE